MASKNAQDKEAMVDYQIDGIEPDMSFLEMLDVFNEDLMSKGGEPVAFDHDCREEFAECVLCTSMVKHGPKMEVTTCQLRTYVQGWCNYKSNLSVQLLFQL
jgi:succinate dehydrogenase / fumarate reductase iron-sulfur subunit